MYIAKLKIFLLFVVVCLFDDCIAVNDDGVFGKHFRNIYPPEMVLEPTNLSAAVCTFLDLRISIFRGKLRYRSYDKRKDFDFEVCNYPNMEGNIPYATSYGAYMSQLVRYCDINQNIESFLVDVKVMTLELLKQGFIKDRLRNTYYKFCEKYLYKWSKYGVDITNESNDRFCN